MLFSLCREGYAHWEPLVLGPALAMDTVKGRSWRRLRLNSSANSPPQMLCPPVPSPASHTRDGHHLLPKQSWQGSHATHAVCGMSRTWQPAEPAW